MGEWEGEREGHIERGLTDDALGSEEDQVLLLPK